MDPATLALLLGGGQALSSIGGFIGGGPQRELDRFKLDDLKGQTAKRNALQEQFSALLKGGDVIGQKTRGQFTAGFNEKIAGILGRMQSTLGRGSSPFSPEVLRALTQTGGRQAGQFQLGLEEKNVSGLQDLRRILLGSTFGG